MIILLRKSDGWLKNTSLFDWQPEKSKNGRWYRVRRENIVASHSDPGRTLYVRQLFTAALAGLVCRVHAKYDRQTKTLELDVMKQ